jgi:GDP-L-fucose synthase
VRLPDAEFKAAISVYPPLINVGCGIDVMIRELAQTVAEVVGFKGTLRFDTTKPDGNPRKVLDGSRMPSFGWRPATSLEAGIALAHRDYLGRLVLA